MDSVYESVPIRVRKSSLPDLRRLKAELMLAEGRNVSDAEVVTRALKLALESKHAKKKGKGLLDYAGFIKGGPRTNATKDLDEVLYGEKP